MVWLSSNQNLVTQLDTRQNLVTPISPLPERLRPNSTRAQIQTQPRRQRGSATKGDADLITIVIRSP